jgi:hypothetical protein
VSSQRGRDQVDQPAAAAMEAGRRRRDAARRLGDGAAGDAAHRLSERGGPHVVEQHRVGLLTQRLVELVEPVDLDLDLDQVAERLARGTRIAAPTPPAAATWLSLISTASSSPKRWLTPPPARTAYFCRARRPGMVLRVQQMRALWPFTCFDQRRRRRGDAAEMAQEVQRHALGRQHAARRAGDRGDAVARFTRLPSGRSMRTWIAGVDQRKASEAASRPADDAGLARHQRRLGASVGRHDGIGGEIAGTAEDHPAGRARTGASIIRVGKGESVMAQAPATRGCGTVASGMARQTSRVPGVVDALDQPARPGGRGLREIGAPVPAAAFLARKGRRRDHQGRRAPDRPHRRP